MKRNGETEIVQKSEIEGNAKFGSRILWNFGKATGNIINYPIEEVLSLPGILSLHMVRFVLIVPIAEVINKNVAFATVALNNVMKNNTKKQEIFSTCKLTLYQKPENLQIMFKA